VLDAHPDGYETHVTQDANHIYSLTEWQADVFDRCCRWLDAQAATRAPRPAAN
jgi:hypothetical protein